MIGIRDRPIKSQDLNEVRELIVSLREDAVWLSCEHPTVDLEIRAAEMLERFLDAAIESRDQICFEPQQSYY
jgi:hypothetical protein